MKTKQEIRHRMKAKREALSKKEIKERSSMIFSNLLSVPEFFRADVVHTYVSSKNNEVDTHQLIRWMLKEKKRVIVPIVDAQTKQMKHSEIYSLSELSFSKLGIYEPSLERLVKASNIGVVIVPALAVDRHGNRIGFGGGFYDRFLTDMKAPSIALAYDFQLISELPVESFDAKISYIVTDKQILRC